MNKWDTVECMTDRYLERYGKALIGFYYLPPMTEHWKFPMFINSLLITLRRQDLLPQYFWYLDVHNGRYLVLWMNGYFRNDVSEITSVIARLWQLHKSTPVTEVGYILLTAENAECGKARLRQLLYSPGFTHQVTANYHQRTFGSSRLL